ncbi:MAG: TlpA family protein disulfide reductase [Paludibacteraceae bacterium]|nr:TlpA family protein disulfide reductase [Paludibacteraceae bacterium]
MRKFFYIILLLISSFSAYAKETKIYGVAPSFAGQKLEMRCNTNLMVNGERVLSACEVDSLGAFSFVFDVTQTMQAFIPTETSRGYIFLEPGAQYEVKLLARQERTLAQKLDPYYQPTDYMLDIVHLKHGDINAQIMEFEDAFDFYSMRHLVYGASPDSLKKSVAEIREIFPDFASKRFLADYLDYRCMLILNMAQNVNQTKIIKQLNDKDIDVENPAFWDLFNTLFNDFIKQSAYDREQALTFSRVIEEGNVKMYLLTIKNRYGINNSVLGELVAIKWLYDLLNSPEYDRTKVYEMLRSLGGAIQLEYNRDILTEILNGASSNLPGMEAPNLQARGVDGKSRSLSDYKGDYIYLNFGNSFIDQTQKDLNVLMRFQNDYGRDLDIINVFLYDQPEQVARLSQRFGGKMNFWIVDDSDAVKKMFGIKSLPAFFLIDKDGTFLMTKGAEPNDELKMLLQRIFRR